MVKQNISIKLFIALVIAVFTGCKKDSTKEVTPVKTQAMFKNVLILGNSITLAPVNPVIGWNIARGMSASVPDSDYVHRLTARLRKFEPTAQVTVKFFDGFESDYPTYNLDNLKEARDNKPDLVIIRVGENVNRAKLDGEVFSKRYQAAVQYLKENDKQMVVLSVGPLWNVPEIDNAMQLYTPYVSLSSVSYDVTNFAFGLFTDPGLAQHPGDKGMRVICDIIWNKILEINPHKDNVATGGQ